MKIPYDVEGKEENKPKITKKTQKKEEEVENHGKWLRGTKILKIMPRKSSNI